MEIESQEGPLSLSLGGNSLDRRDMEGDEDALGVVRHKNRVVHLVDINEAGFKVLGKLSLTGVRLHVLHLLDLFFLGPALYLAAIPALPKLLDLALLQLGLRLLARLLLALYFEVLGAQPRRFDLACVDMSRHAHRIVLTRLRLAAVVHALVLFFLLFIGELIGDFFVRPLDT